MFKKTLLFTFFTLLSYSLLFSQSGTVKFDNVTNKYTLQKNTESNNTISVFITDNKNASNPKQFSFNNTVSESTFVNTAIAEMKAASVNYFFVNDNNEVVSIEKGYTDYNSIKINKPESEEVLKSLLESSFKLENETIIEFWPTLNDGNSFDVFEGFEDNFELIKEADVVHFKYKIEKDKEDEEKKIEVDSDNVRVEIFKALFNDFESVVDVLKPLLISEKRFNQIKDLKLNETNRFVLSELYKALKNDLEYKFINNIILKSNTKPEESKVYKVNVKNNNKSNYYILKFCDQTRVCNETNEILYSTNKELFSQIIKDFIKINSDFTLVDDNDLTELFNLIDKNNEESKITAAKKPLYETIASLVQAIENLETQHSGKLKLNKTVRVYENKHVVEGSEFIADYATVRFFNNKAKDIVVVGTLTSNNREFTVVNVQFSVALRSFRNTLNYVPISPNDDDTNLSLNYNDLFEYYPNEENSNYSVRNKAYRIAADSIVPIEERKLMDYFTAVIFSDFLGLNDQNSNSLMQAEGRVKIPIWNRNYRWVSWIHALNADINASIYNGFDDNSRFITPSDFTPPMVDDSSTDMIDETKINSTATINNFDYIKYNNLNAGISLDFLNIEMKALSTDWSFGYGLRYYRAGLKYTETTEDVDVVKKYQLNALTHEFNTNFEIRPQLNFGADLNIALNWLHDGGSVENLDILYNTNDGNDEKKILRLQLNLYSKVDPSESNGGIYARIGGFYHLGAKDFYPQILVGYATNLSSFVNKFSSK
ncbi:hypothetical protein [Algibacter pacificus]|uniref:hypothetical protein n=1 Tax=Algibacter pacificus TaxID=2599389 RepID=UPI0011C6FDB3|nr:hypothetical protein [Algibacter pacificus]